MSFVVFLAYIFNYNFPSTLFSWEVVTLKLNIGKANVTSICTLILRNIIKLLAGFC